MNYRIERNVSGSVRGLRSTGLPLRNLAFSRIEDGKLKGDALLLEDKTIGQVAPSVYKAAKRMGVSVALRSVPEGVRVFHVKPH